MSEPVTEQLLPARVLLSAWCEAISVGLSRGGVRDVVISPGSRNSPLIQLIVKNPELASHSVIDERSAGFFALGLSRASRVPVALLCTSGTAAAHYYPALLEASYDGVPLVILSADRPEELQNCGAPQTISQRNLYANFVRSTLPLPSPRDEVKTFSRLHEGVADAVRTAMSPRPGPVHVNIPLRKPLEPASPTTKRQQSRYDSLLHHTTNRVNLGSPSAPVDVAELVQMRSRAQRPLVVAGPVRPQDVGHVRTIATAMGASFVGEFGPQENSGLEFASQLLGRDSAPDFVLHVGPPAISTAWNQYITNDSAPYFVLPGTEFREPTRRAQNVIVGELGEIARAITAGAKGLLPSFHQNEVGFGPTLRAAPTIDRYLAGAPPDDEVAAVRTVLKACTPETNLVLGNSLSVRIASWVWPTLSHVAQPFTARGVNGIDGTIASAAGIAHATRCPTLALLGDVTAAHDIGSLQLLTAADVPLTLVVLDNGGGRIFNHLPAMVEMTEQEARYLMTPPCIDFASACTAFGVEFMETDEHHDLEMCTRAALGRTRPTLIRVRTDPDSSIGFLHKMKEMLSK